MATKHQIKTIEVCYVKPEVKPILQGMNKSNQGDSKNSTYSASHAVGSNDLGGTRAEHCGARVFQGSNAGSDDLHVI